MGPLFIRQTTSSWLLRKPRVNFGGRKTILYIYFDIIKLIKNDCLKDSWRRGAKLQQEMEYQIKKSALFILCFCSDSFLYSKQNVRWLDWSLKRRRVSIEVDRCWCVCFGSRCDGLRFLHGGLTFHFSPFFLYICIYIYISLWLSSGRPWETCCKFSCTCCYATMSPKCLGGRPLHLCCASNVTQFNTVASTLRPWLRFCVYSLS